MCLGHPYVSPECVTIMDGPSESPRRFTVVTTSFTSSGPSQKGYSIYFRNRHNKVTENILKLVKLE